MQIAYFMPHIILSSVACPAQQYFSTLSHKGTFWEKFIENKMRVSILSTTFA
jgi:hypothetical protein